MRWLRSLLSTIVDYFMRRIGQVLRLIVGIFMIVIGGWFVLAPFTQGFFTQPEALSSAPYLWLIVPVGIVQIVIGLQLLRPLFKRETT